MVSLAEKSAGFEHTLVAVEHHVATITLNRPHRRNALNFPAYDELEQSAASSSPAPIPRSARATTWARSWPGRVRWPVRRCR